MFLRSIDSYRVTELLSGYYKLKDGQTKFEKENNRFSLLIKQANLTNKDLHKIIVRICLYCFLGIIFLYFSSTFLSVTLVMFLIWLEYRLIKSKIERRVKLFERDYPAFLLSLAASVKTGLDPIVALIGSARLFTDDSLLKSSINEFAVALDQGIREEKCIKNFASDIAHPDLDLLRSALLLARSEGSSLSQCLLRLSKITRQRQSFRRKIKAALSMQKLSALGIALCALIIASIQIFANLQVFKETIANPTGQKLLVAGIGLMLLGLFWMLRMAKERI
jgi:Flp pilus assembly protein TadB